MLAEEKLRRADVVASVILCLIGALVLLGAAGMPMSGSHGGREIRWYTSPAFLPLVIGALLIACSLGVLARAVRRGGHRNLAGELRRALGSLPPDPGARHVARVALLISGYVALLWLHPFAWLTPHLRAAAFLDNVVTGFLQDREGANYVLCSAAFLAAAMSIWWRPRGRSRIALVAALSLLLPWGVGWCFSEQLHAPLPW